MHSKLAMLLAFLALAFTADSRVHSWDVSAAWQPATRRALAATLAAVAGAPAGRNTTLEYFHQHATAVGSTVKYSVALTMKQPGHAPLTAQVYEPFAFRKVAGNKLLTPVSSSHAPTPAGWAPAKVLRLGQPAPPTPVAVLIAPPLPSEVPTSFSAELSGPLRLTLFEAPKALALPARVDVSDKKKQFSTVVVGANTSVVAHGLGGLRLQDVIAVGRDGKGQLTAALPSSGFALEARSGAVQLSAEPWDPPLRLQRSKHRPDVIKLVTGERATATFASRSKGARAMISDSIRQRPEQQQRMKGGPGAGLAIDGRVEAMVGLLNAHIPPGVEPSALVKAEAAVVTLLQLELEIAQGSRRHRLQALVEADAAAVADSSVEEEWRVVQLKLVVLTAEKLRSELQGQRQIINVLAGNAAPDSGRTNSSESTVALAKEDRWHEHSSSPRVHSLLSGAAGWLAGGSGASAACSLSLEACAAVLLGNMVRTSGLLAASALLFVGLLEGGFVASRRWRRYRHGGLSDADDAEAARQLRPA